VNVGVIRDALPVKPTFWPHDLAKCAVNHPDHTVERISAMDSAGQLPTSGDRGPVDVIEGKVDDPDDKVEVSVERGASSIRLHRYRRPGAPVAEAKESPQ
jgi:hypothetical protein